jgi:hypothetical protein
MAKPDGGTVHVTARVPVELAQEFERVATEEDRSISAELRRVMRLHVEAWRQNQAPQREDRA